MAHDPIIDEDVVAISGGFLPYHGTFPVRQAWIASTYRRQGLRFVKADRMNPKFLEYTDGKVDMLNHLTALRNAKVEALMQDGGQDSAEAEEELARNNKRTKVEKMDDVDDVLTLKVFSGGEEHSVRVMSTWHGRHKLGIELTEANLKLLLADPEEYVEEFRPKMSQPNVHWRKQLRQLYIRFFSDGKWKFKTKRVIRGDLSAEAYQDLIDSESATLQEHYESHHDPDSLRDDRSVSVSVEHDGAEQGSAPAAEGD